MPSETDDQLQAPTRETPPNLVSYEDEVSTFQVTVPEQFNSVVDIVESWAASHPNDVALLSLDHVGKVVDRRTAAELAELAQKSARALLAQGVRKGDRVLVMLPRVPAWYAAMLGAIRIGAVPSPTPNLSAPRDLAYRIEKLEAVAVITDTTGAAKLAQIGTASINTFVCWSGDDETPEGWLDFDELMSRETDAVLPAAPTTSDDDMLVFFTSGTVSYAKMVVHQQSYGLGHVSTARFWHDLRVGDLHWTISDTGWAKAAWGGLFGQWHERATVVQVALERPTADAVLSVLANSGITSFCAPPTIYRSLIQADLTSYDLKALRHCTSAGEPLNPEVIRIWREGTGGLTVYDGYGQTETTCLCANFRSQPVKPGSMGRPMPGYQLAVHDENGQPADVGVVGNIAVRADPAAWAPGLFHGYAGESAATAEVIRDGWYYTGDKAKIDEDGYYWFEGRSDDVITSSAYRIGPFEVESALIEHPAVMEAAVVGKPDPERTEIVTAFIILAEGWEGSDQLVVEIQDHVKALTAPYKYPREIHFVRALPKTISGKIRRSELRANLASGKAAE